MIRAAGVRTYWVRGRGVPAASPCNLTPAYCVPYNGLMVTEMVRVHFRPPADPKPWTPTPDIVEAMVQRVVERFDPE